MQTTTFKDKYIKILPFFSIIMICLFIAIYQFTTNSISTDSDTFFHYSRFFDAAQQLKTGNISLFQLNWSFNQSGRFINVFYGPVFTYLMGAILLVTKTWVNFQIVTNFIFTFLTGLSMYLCLKKYWPQNIFVNTLISLQYMTTNDIWNLRATFTSISLFLFPLVLNLALKMLYDKEKISWLQLGLTMAVICQIHLLSTILFALFLLPFAIISLIKTSYKQAFILKLIKAIMLFLGLTANIWYVILYFKIFDSLALPRAWDLTISPYGIKYFGITKSLILLALFVYTISNFRSSYTNNVLLFITCFWLFVSSNLFPWKLVQDSIPVLKQALQFPERFSVLIAGAFSALTTSSIKDINKKNNYFKYPIYCLMILGIVSGINRDKELFDMHLRSSNIGYVQQNARNSNEKDVMLEKLSYINYKTPDYLPVKDKDLPFNSFVKLYKNNITDTYKLFNHQVLKPGKLKLTWKTIRKKTTVLPIFIYKDSILIVNGKKLLPKTNIIGNPIVYSRHGVNSAYLTYKIPKSIIIVFYSTSLIWLIVLFFFIYRQFL